MGETAERNEQTRRRVQKENGELTVISPTAENEDEEKQWNRKKWLYINYQLDALIIIYS